MMNRWIICICFLAVTASQVHSQGLVVVSKVSGDSVSIKWLPANFDHYKKITNGATVSRIESGQLSNYEAIDFKSAKTWTIGPAKNRYENLDQSTPDGEKMAVLLEPAFESSNSAERKNFAFGIALIENVINPKFQFVVGNILVDKDIESNKTYVYKIEVKGIKDAYIFVNPNKETKYSSIDDLALHLDHKTTVDIEWSAERYEKEAFGFEVEHAMDEITEGDFLTETPFLPFKSEFEKEGVNALYRDSPEQGHFHYYRIHGIDMFGHVSLVSEWKKIYVPLQINAWVEIDSIYSTENKRIVNGSIHVSGTKNTVSNVSLIRSSEREGQYSTLETVPFSDSLVQFAFEEAKTGDHYYYKIVLTNKDDSVLSTPRYFFTLDQEPPSPPSNVQATIDSNGVVSLTWEKPNDTDLLGYRVFRANTQNEEFVEKTRRLSIRPVFSDTVPLNNLTPELYYSIQAVDLNYNQSILSDTILVLKPDTVAPIPAVINRVDMKDSVLIIVWTNSDSEDLRTNYLLRTFKGTTDTLQIWSGRESEFADTAIVAGNYYIYRIVTEDKSRNSSESNEITKYYEPGYRLPLTNFIATVDMETKSIKLTWNQPEDEVFSYQIFRGKADQKILPLKTISGEMETQFEDKNVRLNNKYIYTIKYINSDGIHSVSARFEVIYQ